MLHEYAASGDSTGVVANCGLDARFEQTLGAQQRRAGREGGVEHLFCITGAGACGPLSTKLEDARTRIWVLITVPEGITIGL